MEDGGSFMKLSTNDERGELKQLYHRKQIMYKVQRRIKFQLEVMNEELFRRRESKEVMSPDFEKGYKQLEQQLEYYKTCEKDIQKRIDVILKERKK